MEWMEKNNKEGEKNDIINDDDDVSTNNKCLNDNSYSNNVIDNYYYPIEGQTDSCFKNESRPSGYYLDILNRKYFNCDNGCQECYEGTKKNV